MKFQIHSFREGASENSTAHDCDLFTKLSHLDSCLKQREPRVDLILDTHISSTLEIHCLFIQSPKNAFEENLKFSFDHQQEPTKAFTKAFTAQ